MQQKYCINSSDTLLQKTPFTFDVSVWEIFWWSFTGARLCLLVPGGEKDPTRIIDAAAKNHVTVIHFVPSMLNGFIEYLDVGGGAGALPGLRQVIASGETLTVSQVKRFNEILYRTNGTRLDNLYGPTEATVDVSHFACPTGEAFERIPIGKPIDNICLYIVDKHLHLQPVGIAGELCIAGAGVARGYLNNPGLTNSKFPVGHPLLLRFSASQLLSFSLYRTGDLARWLPDGNIEFLGREDHQVKIRGSRVELGEIENQLLKHEQVKEALVIDRERHGENGDGMREETYLCAYIVPAGEMVFDGLSSISTGLREYLAAGLPDYMIPTYFVPLEKLPLTPNGKIDRKALPPPEVKKTGEYIAPRNQTEKKLAEIWADVLGVDQKIIGIDTSFFDLGGHSLRATMIVARIHKELDAKLTLAAAFQVPTIRRMAETVKGLTADKYITIRPAEEKEYYALSPGQRRLYVIQQMDLESTSYNIPTIVRVKGHIDKKRFERALEKLIARHDVLRTSFEVINDVPVQRVHGAAGIKVDYYDIEDSERLEGRKQTNRIIRKFVKPFELSHGPLMRAGLIKAGKEEYVLMVDKHHIIADGLSQGILVDEFTALYAGEELPPLRLQYTDYSEWQSKNKSGDVFTQREKYWVKEFDGELPVLRLPYDFSPSAARSLKGGMTVFQVPADVTGALKQLAAGEGATLFMMLLSTFNVLLSKLSHQEDIIIGTNTAGRQHADLQSLIGMFVNTVPLRNYPKGDTVFAEFLAEVKVRTLEAFENQDYPVEDLLNKLQAQEGEKRNSLFNVFFGSHDLEGGRGPGRDIQGLEVELMNSGKQVITMPFDLGVGYVVGETINIHLDYAADLFKPSTIDKIKTYYIGILEQVIEDRNIKIKDIRMAHELLNVPSTILQEKESDFVF
jgi:non-ribosomal peptide synthetase component F/acyl carrier protein